MADSVRSGRSAGSANNSITSILSAKKAANKLKSRSSSKGKKAAPSPVSSAFWEVISGREQASLNETLVDECRKRRSRVVKAGNKVSDINQAIVDARDVNDVGRAAVLRITLKDAERMYKFYVGELREWLGGKDNLPPGEAKEAEVDACAPLLHTFDTYFSADRPRPPSPPIGPIEEFEGTYFGNEYNGSYLPWKRERHGFGHMQFTDGSFVEGTFVRNQLHGAATLSYNDGLRTYVGGWKCGQRHGHGLLEATHGVQCIRWEGRWRKGLPNGPGVYTTRAGHAVAGEWRKPRLVHGGRAIRFSKCSLRLPGGGGVVFEGKAELENASSMRLRLLDAKSGKLQHAFGASDVDWQLSKLIHARAHAAAHGVAIDEDATDSEVIEAAKLPRVRWLCHVCFYRNGESDDDGSSDDDSSDDDIDMEYGGGGGGGGGGSKDFADHEEIVSDDEHDEDEDELAQQVDDDDVGQTYGVLSEPLDTSHLGSSPSSNVLPPLEGNAAAAAESGQPLPQLLEEGETKEPPNDPEEIVAWMVNAGVEIDRALRYVDTLTNGKTVKPKLLSLSKVAEAWRSLGVDDLVAEPYYIRRQDANVLCATAPFLMDDNSTVASTSTTLTLATANTLNTGPVGATGGNPVGSPSGNAGGAVGNSNSGSPPAVSEQVWHASSGDVTSTVLQLGTAEESKNDATPLLPPLQPPPEQLPPQPTKEEHDPGAASVASTLQSGVVADVEALIDKFKRRHGHRVTASEFFGGALHGNTGYVPGSPGYSSMHDFDHASGDNASVASGQSNDASALTGRSFESHTTPILARQHHFSHNDGSVGSGGSSSGGQERSATGHSQHRQMGSTKHQQKPGSLSSASTMSSPMLVLQCRNCACDDIVQERFGPLGRLAAARLIDPNSFPRNVVKVPARREMGRNIMLGQPYYPGSSFIPS